MQDLEELKHELKQAKVPGGFMMENLIQIAIAERLETAVVQMSLMNGFLDGILTEIQALTRAGSDGLPSSFHVHVD